MAISIPVQATADDRTFQRIASRYEKWGQDTGKKIGSALADGLDDPKIEKAFSKVSDAMSKVRAEEAKLQDLRNRGASDARIVTQSEALARARTAEVRATNDAVRAYDSLHASTSRLSSATGMLSNAMAGTRFGSLAADVSTLTDRFGAMGLKAGLITSGIAGIAVGTVAATKALYDLGAKWDSVMDNIALKTGKVGAELDGLKNAVGDIGRTTAADLSVIGDVASQLSQAFPKLSENSDDFRTLGSNLSYLAENGQAVDIRELGKAFTVLGVSTSDYVSTLDDLANASQKTGAPLNEIISQLRQGAPLFKQFGMDAKSAAAFLGSFDESGLDATNSLVGLRTALVKVGGDSRGAAAGLADVIDKIKSLHDAGNDPAARKLAEETFGRRAFAPFLEAIENGTLDLEKLKTALTEAGIPLQDMQKNTDDGAQGWKKLKNAWSETLAPLGDFIFSKANQPLLLMTENLDNATNSLKNLASVPITPDSALGKMLAPGGVPQGVNGSGGLGGAGGVGGTVFGTDHNLNDFQGGFYNLPSDSSSSSKANIPTAQYSLSGIPLGQFPGEQGMPGLPGRRIEQHTGPGGYEVDPQKVFDAETGVMSANQRVEEARRRVLELRQDNNATEAQIQDAQNGLILAGRNALKAQQDLIDAQQGTWKKAEDATKKLSQGMDQIGAALDNDLGISKGLPGLAENLVKFLANIAAAPVLGQLSAISAAHGGLSASGSGFIGMAGAQGAFGPQYQIAGFDQSGKPYTMAQLQSGAVTPGGSTTGGSTAIPGGGGAPFSGYPGDAALLGAIRPGSYETPGRGNVWDLTKGLGDCSSSIEDLVNILDGRPTGGRSMATGNEAQWLMERGFLPTDKPMPGTFQVGFNSGHTQATLPGGTNFNWGSDSAAAKRGVDGAGAWDPAFTSHYYRPVSGGGSAPASSTGGGGGWTGGSVTPGAGAPPLPTGGGGPYAPLTPGQLTSPGLTSPVPGGGGTGGGGGFPGLGGPPQAFGGSSPGLAIPSPGAGVGGGTGAAVPSMGGGMQPNTTGGGGFAGIGGAPMAAISAAASGLDMLAPGAGAAAQIGIQEINRAIGYAGQVAGIGVSGLLETFLPTDSPLSNVGNSWLGKIASGFAGARPALPNVAGGGPNAANQPQGGAGGEQPPGSLNGPPADPGKGDQSGTTINNNVNVNNQSMTEDRQGADISRHLTAMNAGPMR